MRIVHKQRAIQRSNHQIIHSITIQLNHKAKQAKQKLYLLQLLHV